MITISLCMIVKDEADNIADCLECARGIADEIVVVDTGSTDGTIEIARRYADAVFEFAWIDDFSAARNFAFSKATAEYILWLDADDRILPEDREKLLALKNELSPDVDAVMMKYNTGFDERGRVTFSFYRERMVRRLSGFQWHEPVHEYIVLAGNVITRDIAITHTLKQRTRDGGRNLRIYESRMEKGIPLSARGQYYYARELMDGGRYEDAAARFSAFIESRQGWVEDVINACVSLGRCLIALGRGHEAECALLYSFAYDTPRAEACCCLGYLYKDQGDYRRALFWFGLVKTLEAPKDGWGFIRLDDWGYVPEIECAVCHYHLGNIKSAIESNERAALYKPDSAAVVHNRAFFSGL